MNRMHRPSSNGADPNPVNVSENSAPSRDASTPTHLQGAVRNGVNLSWVSFGIAAAVVVALSGFMLQNTGTATYSFLWLHGTLPVALVLLIAAGGGFLLAQFRGLISRRG
jgi:uncharacterized integral membrane protein